MRAWAIVLALALAACDSPTNPYTGAAGLYDLVAINGKSLPTADRSVMVVSGWLGLGRDRGFDLQVTYNQTVTWSESREGVYELRGEKIFFDDSVSDGVSEGRLGDGSVTWNGYLYQRR